MFNKIVNTCSKKWNSILMRHWNWWASHILHWHLWWWSSHGRSTGEQSWSRKYILYQFSVWRFRPKSDLQLILETALWTDSHWVSILDITLSYGLRFGWFKVLWLDDEIKYFFVFWISPDSRCFLVKTSCQVSVVTEESVSNNI
jgi:hypothetical protein